MSGEATFQDKLRDLIGSVISRFKFDGCEFSRIERGFRIDGREPDLTLLIKPSDEPFLIIETKRKVEGPRARELFEPLGKAAVGQAISYVALYYNSGRGFIPFFATANPSEIAVFRTPQNVLDFVSMDSIRRRDYSSVLKPGRLTELLNNYLVLHRKVALTEDFVIGLLDALVREYARAGAVRAAPGWALIGFLRSFVEKLSERIEPIIRQKANADAAFKSKLYDLGKRLGYMPDVKSLAKMMSYVFMNKIIFYKVLEGKYRIPRMAALDTSSKTSFLNQINAYFERAIAETKDFEPIFRAGVYDEIDLPDEPDVLEYINEFIETLDAYDVESLGEYAGYIYEDLIEPSERHQLGQFYTPPAICELIAKWAIRGEGDVVLDPGCGSGGFLLAAYRELLRLKTGRLSFPPPRGVHERILQQLYGVDINAFPAHLTAMNLAMKDVRSPSTGLNIIEGDFFLIEPQTRILAPYTIKTAAGEFRREMVIPLVDAVIGNPPYTRWVEIPEPTQKAIRDKLGSLMEKYGLTPQISRGIEPGIYTYWIMHATRFLKEGGRLGMIISNLWMQTDYGIGFGQFLLDHYKIKAIIDFTLRLFTALISTCVLLLERESDETKRAENDVVLVHIPGTVESVDVDEILKAVSSGTSQKLKVKVLKQRDIPRNEKWIKLFFEAAAAKGVYSHPLMIKLGELFEPSFGNAEYLVLVSQKKIKGVRNPGASEFVYLSPSKAREFGLEGFAYPHVPLEGAILYPAITSSRYAAFFTFTEDDWRRLYNEDKECYMFICHKPLSDLPEAVRRYIRWGEPICPQCGARLRSADGYFVCDNGHRVPLEEKCVTKLRETRGGGRLASETESAKARVRKQVRKLFYGWYDLGGVRYAPIFAVYQARYKTRFIWCMFPVAMYHALIAFIPKPGVNLTEAQIKALLAYLNSSFTQYYIETHGRYIAKGPIGLEVEVAREMPVLNVLALDQQAVNRLSALFDELEKAARDLGGASERDQVEKLKPIIHKIDAEVEAALGLPQGAAEEIEKLVDALIERRVAGSKEERRDSIKGEVEAKVKPRKSRRRGGRQGSGNTATLIDFLGKGSG